MKKTACLGVLLLVSVVFLFCIVYSNDRYTLSFMDNGDEGLLISIHYETGNTEIKPWYSDSDGAWYYFLPGFVDTDKIWCGQLKKGSLRIDGHTMDSFFAFKEGNNYELVYSDKSYKSIFCKASEISSIFIKTKSGGLDYIHQDKENRETGTLLSLNSRGDVEYNGRLEKISGHGNYTWIQKKKPYNIKLAKQGKLGGLHSSADWNLLSMWYDGDKIHSRLAFDIASILGAGYVPGCSWVDLYINGDYMGLYLLAESVSGFESFNLDQGEFLLEKEFIDRYDEQPYITTDSGSIFSIVRPKEDKRTQRQADEIENLLQKTEDAINAHDYNDNIDVDSFAIQFLVEEISLNFDAFVTSTYIYKPAYENKLYAGPAWDYDGAFGEYLHQGLEWVKPDGTVINSRQGEQLDWYAELYETDEFLSCVISRYEHALPELIKLFSETIEQYADLISCSADIDRIRWGQAYDEEVFRAGSYNTWYSNVRYLQYFCLNRLLNLSKRWNVSSPEISWASPDTYHTVIFNEDGQEILKLNIRDGDTVQIDNVSGLEKYRGGYWTFSYDENEAFNQYLPILEDCVLNYHR